MADFRLRDQVPLWFDGLASRTDTDIALCVFAVAWPMAAMAAGYGAVLAYPHVRPRVEKAFWTSIKWQVRRIFEWAKWYGHTMESVYYSVLCALAVSTSVGIWITLPILRPILVVLVIASLLTFTVLGYIEAGPRATPLRFAKSFYVPTVGYSALAALLAFSRTIIGLL